MTFGNEIFHAATDFVHHAEGAAHALLDEVETDLKAAGHQVQLFGEGVLTGAVLNPINGVEQIINNVAGTHLPPLELTNQEEVNHSIAGKIGIVGGTILDFVLTDGAAGAVMGVEAGSMASLAVAGAVQGGILTPSDSSKTGGAFFLDRVENAAIDAATFATMGGIAGKLGSAYEPGAALTTRMFESAAINGIGGAAGGIVNAEGTTLLKEGRFATKEELESAAWQGGAMGAGFGAGTVALEAAVGVARGPVKPGDDIRARLNRGYNNPDQVAGQIDIKTPVSQEFLNNVAGTIDRFPDQVRRFMVDQDLRVQVGKQVTDINPTLKGQHPNGWAGGTWENAEGYYYPTDGAVVTEYRVNNAGRLVRSDRVQSVARHEIGHGIDDLMTPFTNNQIKMSQTPDFQAAWSADIAKLSPSDLTKLEYYIQASNPTPGRGASEAFADLFAAVNGGSANPQETAYIMKMFPRTTVLMRKTLPTLP